MVSEDKKRLIKDFEDMTLKSELNALQKVSFERPLTDCEFERFKVLCDKRFKGEI